MIAICFVKHLTAKMCSFHTILPVYDHLLFYIFLYIILSYCFNKFQTPVWGHTKIPGGECLRNWKWDMKDMEWLMHGGVRETGWGCQQIHMCVGTTLLHIYKVFSCPECRNRWQWCHFMMSLMPFLHMLGKGYICLFGSAVWLVPWLVHLGSHRPSTSATPVPLEEWNYNQAGKCSLFVQLYVLKVILGTLT